MTWLRTLLAGLVASMARDEASGARLPVLAEPREKTAPAPLRDPLAEEDQVLEAQP